MDTKFERTYHRLEEEHFWFRSRRELLSNLLRSVPKNSKILDVGCSSGILLDLLRSEGFHANNLYGIDISNKAVALAKDRGFKNVFVKDAQNFQLSEKFDVIIASDCLEHLDYEEMALNTWLRHLNNNGELLVFVPAFQSLWSHHDVVNHHKRRYTRSALVGLFDNSACHVSISGYWNSLLFPVIWMLRKIKNLPSSNSSNASGDLQRLPPLNSAFYTLLKLEEKWFGRFSFPFGVSAYCIVRKDN